MELGRFPSEEMAAAAYNFASRLFFGEFRRENQGVPELSDEIKRCVFQRCQNKIDREGWHVDTDEYKYYMKKYDSAQTSRVFLSA